MKETFFMRQRHELDAIDWKSMRACAAREGRDRINIWVAGCASGEEAYSLALLASDAFAPDEPPVSILATDISDAALAAARRGSYGRRSLRGVGGAGRERYFAADGERLIVGARLRALVTFRRHNLVGDAPPLGTGPFELIACRNVLIYFDGDSIEKVIRSLEHALSCEGTLLLGAADRLCGSARRLSKLEHREERRTPSAPAHARAARGVRRVAAPVTELISADQKSRREAIRAIEGPLGGATIPDALRMADGGDLARALDTTARILKENPLDSDAHFIRGMAELGLGDPTAAVSSFRRALYVDPTFGLAAFKLARAHEACGDRAAAYRAYERALRTPRAGNAEHAIVLDHVDSGDLAAACAIRLRALADVSASVAVSAGGEACGS